MENELTDKEINSMSGSELLDYVITNQLVKEGETAPGRGKNMAQEALGYTDNEIDAVDFTYWICHTAEKWLEDLIIADFQDAQDLNDKTLAKLKITIQAMDFGKKVQCLNEINTNSFGKKTKLYQLYQLLLGFRNHVSHGRLNKLTYENKPLWDSLTQIKLVQKLAETFKK